MLAGLDTGVARVQWSPQGDPAGTWGSDPATGADYQDLDPTNGFIRQIVGGEYGVIFQERAITRMTFVGSPLWFQFDEVESGRGTQAPGSVVKVGNAIFYLGFDGFYLFDGTASRPIGVNRVNKSFLSDVDANYLHRVKAVAHPQEPLVYFFYPSASVVGAGGLLTKRAGL